MSNSDSSPEWPSCACGCGEPASRAPSSNSRGQRKGQPMRYKIGHGPQSPPKKTCLSKHGWRQCSACGHKKRANVENFPPSKYSPDGCGSICRPCRAEKERQRRLANPESTMAKAREGYHRLKGDGLAGRLRAAKRRELKMASNGDVTSEAVRGMYASQGGRCYYCQEPLEGTYALDHKTPLSRGGKHEMANLCCACSACNGQKSARTEDEYAQWLLVTEGRLIKLFAPEI